MEILLAPSVWPFSVALAVMLGLAIIEVLLFMLGVGLSSFVDDLLPDMGGTDAPETLSFSKAFAFVGVGKVPAVIVLMSLLASFGLAGVLLQHAADAVSGAFLPLAAAVPAAVVASAVFTGRVAAFLGRVLPSEETSAVSGDTLIGRVATVTYGEASHELPASAKVTDPKGGVHHIQLKAGSPEEVFLQGENALLVSRAGGFYFGAQVPPGTN